MTGGRSQTSVERVWAHDDLRAVDTSMRTLVASLGRALGGLTVAALASRWINDSLLHLGGSGVDLVVGTAVIVGLSGVALFFTSARPIRSALFAQRALILASEAELMARVAQQTFLHDVQNALDMGETEADALGVTATALAAAAPGAAELLVADASRAHLVRGAGVPGHEAPGCGVETPWGCPAVRRGRTLRFEDSQGLAACPRLAERAGPPCSAVCVPITILGTPSAVIHATAPVGAAVWTDAVVDRLEGVAVQVGTRLGVLRAMARSQLQAETDPLTGLLNRRAMEERVRGLRTTEQPFAVAMADLDHFKALNDRFGHDTGDRALRTFARVIREAVRDADLVSRHGGEEFVVVLPQLDALGAAPVLHRIREQLKTAVGSALVPDFTVSMGVADSTWSPDLADVLRAADQALMQAKEQGRDRLVIADHPTPQVPLTGLPQPTPR
jgi:diguanylate cyclase (GGDEF)-like protein